MEERHAAFRCLAAQSHFEDNLFWGVAMGQSLLLLTVLVRSMVSLSAGSATSTSENSLAHSIVTAWGSSKRCRHSDLISRDKALTLAVFGVCVI